jgi:SH3-like domain-containing protein
MPGNRLTILALCLLVANVAASQASAVFNPELPVPRFASLGSDKVYMREGPTYRHPILWVYRRKGLPVEVLAQYDVWRRVKDSDGTVGWVHSSMIAETRTIVVTARSHVPLRRTNDLRSQILALAQPGVVAKLEACATSVCEIETAGTEGWIEKKNIWGVKPGEVFH